MRRCHWIRPANLTLVMMLALTIGALATTVTAGAPVQGTTGPDLIITKQVSLARLLTPGDPITFTLAITNVGGATALGVVVTDAIPSQIVATSFESTLLVTSTGVTSYVWEVTPLAASSGGVITIHGTIDAGLPPSATVMNEAVVYDPADTDAANNTSSVTIRRYMVFLPMVQRTADAAPPATPTPANAFYGRLTFNGQPAVGKTMHLRFSASHYSYLSATTTVDVNGNYSFTNMPGLETGQRYVGLYPGTDGAGYLSVWWTRSITSYTAGESVDLGSADIADLSLVHPDFGSDTMPVTFQWIPRPHSPTDSYQLLLENYNGTVRWWSGPLGYTGTYTLQSLPADFYTGESYTWYVMISAPDGGSSRSEYRTVTFSFASPPDSDTELAVPVGWREDATL